MGCFDRVGERAKLLNSIKGRTNFCYVSGRSGVGKSQVVSSVLDSEYGCENVLKYEFGRNPISPTQFLLVCLIQQQSIGFKFLQSIKSIKLNEFNLNIPMIGKAPLKWSTESIDLGDQQLQLKDILMEIEGPIYATSKREILRISNLLTRTQFKAIWLSNIESIRNNDLGVIFLFLKYISPNCLVIIEGAHSEMLSKQLEEQLQLLCKQNMLLSSIHKIKPFSEHFARGFFDYLELAEKGFVFNYKSNLGYPVAIQFDLNENEKNKALGTKLDTCFSESEQTNNTLLFLSFIFATENRYPNVITLAEAMDIDLSLTKPIELGIVKLTDNLCELAHPQIARYISLTKRQEIFKLLKRYYEKNKDDTLIEIDIAAMAYIIVFDNELKSQLLNRGVSFILEQLSTNNMTTSEQVLCFVEEGVESLSTEQLSNPSISKLCISISLLRLQLDGMLCRLTGVTPNANNSSPMELLIFAQVRMRLIDLRGSIALAEAASVIINSFDISEDLSRWLNFCAIYIKLSCLIALGEFSEYKREYQKLKESIATRSDKTLALFSLLPPHGQNANQYFMEEKLNDTYLSARFNNNKACEKMVTNVFDEDIAVLLRNSIEAVAKEGSIEVTFPINNYALHAAYNGQVEEAIDTLFNMVDHCTYPYDYFSAYNNLAITMALKGSLEQALEFSNKAHNYITDGCLSDPVFVIKSHFNFAILCFFNGNSNAWSEFKLKNFEFSQLPTKYRNLLNKKTKYVDDNLTNPNLFTLIQNNNIEMAHALWPQNLQFWDFMYPIVSSDNINEIIENGIYSA